MKYHHFLISFLTNQKYMEKKLNNELGFIIVFTFARLTLYFDFDFEKYEWFFILFSSRRVSDLIQFISYLKHVAL
jgi:hypothetical protein